MKFIDVFLFVYLLCVPFDKCQAFHSYTRTIPEPLTNIKLDATKIDVFTTWNDLNCIQRCFRISQCNGINTKAKTDGSVLCELLSIKSAANNDKMVKEDGWKHYNLRTLARCDEGGKNLCSDTSEYCIDDVVQPQGYLCAALHNIAYKKNTKQSSFLYEFGKSSNAVDGNHNSNYGAGSCTHTTHEASPWWMVDFGKEAAVYSVNITNRADCCSERLGKFDILVGYDKDHAGNGNSVCQENLSMAYIVNKFFKCQTKLYGRYLFIKSRLNVALSLCEVDVFGELYN